MARYKPRVSIGLAVYNGEKYLEKAIDSILAQTFTDFELIISDNASTDRTLEICQKYAAQDSRIRYHRNQTNIGGANNENLTFNMSCGEYFRWAAHDDVCAPTLLAKLVAALDNDQSIVLAHSKIMQIDENDEPIEILNQDKATIGSPSSRFRDLTGWDHLCEATYGLIRSEIMAKTGLQRNYTDSDRTFLCHLSLYGKFYLVPEVLFYKRIHPQMSTMVYSDWHERMTWFGNEYSDKIVLPHWMQFFHYLEIITSTPISLTEKFHCYFHVLFPWIFKTGRWQWMGKEILVALRRMFYYPKRFVWKHLALGQRKQTFPYQSKLHH